MSGDTAACPILSGQLRRDLRTAARVIRFSSWPADMVREMEATADRLDLAADNTDSPVST